MHPLPSELRRRLERAIVAARKVAEEGANKALDALAVGRGASHEGMSLPERGLRERLRAHGRQLGDHREAKTGVQSTRRLMREIAYEHWHRMLFARFLAENGLLIEPGSRVAVTLEECKELAGPRGDAWELAASYAQHLLPQIFRAGDPVLAVPLPPETRQELQRLLAELPPELFQADDALGWTYQFWQSAEKEAVNARVKSGEKITGETLPAVTQLFTEPYMVQFLLHNTIGAWHAGKVLAARPELAAAATSEQQLREAVALPGCAFEYLRFVREPREGEDPNAGTGPGRPAAGTYPNWPREAKSLKVLDPCCGSGHFLVAAFDLLVRLRSAEEGSDLDSAIRAVLQENLFGLELDGRCTQIAAFHLALAAWRLAGRHLELPALQIACSGIGPHSSKEDWLTLAEEVAARGGMPAKRDLLGREDSLLSDALRVGLERLHETFQLAPELGSLIDPTTQASDLFVAGYDEVQLLLDAVLASKSGDDETHERAVAAQVMARATQILVGPPDGYTLVVTNVPYLGRGSQSERLKEFAEKHYGEAKADLATVFLARMLRWLSRGTAGAPTGTLAAVTPQNWLFLTSYKRFRERLLGERTWEIVARLGPGAFETIGGHVVNVALLAISGAKPDEAHLMAGLDVSAHRGQPPIPAAAKAALLRGESATSPPTASTAGLLESVAEEIGMPSEVGVLADGSVRLLPQKVQILNPDARITMCVPTSIERMDVYAESLQGISPADNSHYARCFWEVSLNAEWHRWQSTSDITVEFAGRELVLWMKDELKDAFRSGSAFLRGEKAWGKQGVAVKQIGYAPVTRYTGEAFDTNIAVIVPSDANNLPALWCFCSSPCYSQEIRKLDSKLNVTNATLVKVPFELGHWREVAARAYPAGLPEPQSCNPTQWLFHGHPSRAEPHSVLQVGVARLLGYRWPAELDEAMWLAPEARALVGRCVALAEHVDGDGIVCLSSIRGEGSAADRLRSLLAAAFGSEWSAAKEGELLRAPSERSGNGKVAVALEDWLRDRFFEEHCALFHCRPFIWHVWDGLPGGFHALVNYHRLAGAVGEGRRTLEKLTSTYLGEWIDRQRQLHAAGEEGAAGRLAAALTLQGELRRILEGQPPYDIFVRWKPLHEQPIGWDPDINDGVRLNIRPFLMAKDVGKKDAGILRVKPDNTWCDKKKPGVKDRGKEPESLRPREQFPWFWGCDPEQHSEHRQDFGAGIPGAPGAGAKFTGERWNGLHYTRAAKEAARARKGAKS